MLAVFVLAFTVGTAFCDFECGLANPEPLASRVVGGRQDTFLKYPWFASMHQPYVQQHQICAGALIAPQFVLTAAHCFELETNIPNELFYHVTLGIYSQCLANSDARTYATLKVYIHEKFTAVENFYDIALLKLDGSSTMMPLCLPPKGTPIQHEEHAQVLGFGRVTSSSKQQPCQINEATVQIFTMAQCRKSSLPKNVTQLMTHLKTSFCAGRMEGGVDTCQGDSGGSIMLQQNNRFYSMGIVSFGYGCAERKLPGVYTNVASYIDWINNTMRGELQIYKPKNEPGHFLNNLIRFAFG